MNTKAEQLQQAARLGAAAFEAGRMAIPAHDPEVLPMLRGRKVGMTPKGEASTVAILKAWQKGWHEANLAAPLFAAADVISSYSRAQALADGVLIDATELAREAGFSVPVALTEAVWLDCVEWSDDATRRKGVPQDVSRRLWDVLWMAGNAARRAPGAACCTFDVYRVPRAGKGRKPVAVRLALRVGSGDAGEPVITISTPNED